MKYPHKYKALTALLLTIGFGVTTQAAIQFDLSPGTGAPPGTLGGYAMLGFPTDLTPEWTSTTSLAPPAGAPVIGNLEFMTPVYHLKAGSGWDTWSHGYTGDVYFNEGNDLMMWLPSGTLAFYLYVQPNLKYTFEFKADSEATTTTLDIDGNAGARYVGFYSDDPVDSLSWIYVKQTTGESDGFAVGEFGINGVIPEPSTWVAGLLLLGVLGLAKSPLRKK